MADPEMRRRVQEGQRRAHQQKDPSTYRSGGKHNTPEYYTLRAMISRCHNPRNSGYKDYGARGIQVCEEWRGPGGFLKFLAAVGPRPSKKHSIDRIKNDGHYEPGNVRWATPEQQASNTRRNHRVTHRGETKTVSDWARVIGISAAALSYRVRSGWSEDRIFGALERIHRKP